MPVMGVPSAASFAFLLISLMTLKRLEKKCTPCYLIKQNFFFSNFVFLLEKVEGGGGWGGLGNLSQRTTWIKFKLVI